MIEIAIKKELPGFALDLELELKKGEFLGVMGPSGSGKSTFLRILAGLEEARGRIVVDGEVWLDGKRALAPQKRSAGMVFQDYALFANMSVLGNLLYVDPDEAFARKLLELVGLWELRDRNVTRLSGGQKQRVALARALMRRPKLLLLDEPLSALDPATRSRLQGVIADLHRAFGTTTIMVSHDYGELGRLAQRVVHMELGKLTLPTESRYREVALR
jgi:molybdate transport system ATP-binding protein